MKKMTITLLLPALMFVGCNQEKREGVVESTMTDTLRIPQEKYLSEKQLQDQVDQEIREILALANDERISDAIQIIATTEVAIQHILDSSYTDAIASLEDAIGKAAVILSLTLTY